MDRCAVHLHAHGQRLLMRMQPREARQQRRMNVQHAPGVMIDEARRQDAHEARQHDQVGREAVDDLRQGGVETVAVGKALVVDHRGGNAVRGGKFEASCVGAVGDHGGNAPGPTLGLTGTNDGFHIRATSGNENDDVFHRGILSSAPHSPEKIRCGTPGDAPGWRHQGRARPAFTGNVVFSRRASAKSLSCR